jgi:hypothetical protein
MNQTFTAGEDVVFINASSKVKRGVVIKEFRDDEGNDRVEILYSFIGTFGESFQYTCCPYRECVGRE